MTKRNHWMIGVIALSFPLVSLLSVPAHADLYHAVESGETLQSVATKYHLSAETLRSLNKLQDVSDSDALPSMLLRIPDGKEKSVSSTRSRVTTSVTTSVTTTSSASFAPRSNGYMASGFASNNDDQASGRGTITKSFLYTVQSGDTIESIANRHTAAGYPVTADAIRSKNPGSENLTVGRTLVIPVQSLSYSAPSDAKTASTVRSIAQDEGGMPLPTFQPPLYTTPGATQPESSTQSYNYNTRRGPTSLSSRSYVPSPNMTRGGARLDGARVISPDEDANVTGTPLSRLQPRSTPAQRATLIPTAQVARIVRTGARIRRLPESDAVTLYSCSTGTEIAVTQQSGPWSAILMSDRSTGWVPTRYLRFTGQNVDVSSQIVANVGGNDAELSYNGSWQSSNPMVTQALKWLGTRYVYGGEGRNGIDCSSLVQHAFAACGYQLPRTAAEQARVGIPVQPADLQPGDRLYFSASGTRIDHTGLYMGNGLFVHASGHGRQVMVSRLSDRRNWNIFVAARRMQ